jgi:hypothetical protein
MKTSQLRIVERLAASLMALAGVAALLGWVLDVPARQSILPGMTTMKANTALCFIVSGLAFWIVTSEKTRGKVNPVAVAFSAVVLLTAGLTLSEYQFSWNLGLDETLFRDLATARNPLPGRMSANTAIAFVLINAALLLLQGRPNRTCRAAAGLLGGLTALFSFLRCWAGRALPPWDTGGGR